MIADTNNFRERMGETHNNFEENIFDRKIMKKGKHNQWNMGYFVYPKRARIVVHVIFQNEGRRKHINLRYFILI